MWIAWAISSLPVPLSPRINTVESVAATEEEVAEFLAKAEHPAIEMDPMF